MPRTWIDYGIRKDPRDPRCVLNVRDDFMVLSYGWSTTCSVPTRRDVLIAADESK